ncbi:LLM class F420-dependent oxidoreductase [Streptomyces sp. NPDC006733]|uniref:LLM class F420-dependent oxidoreductase n=1 Tax=Streptomyces sp. NPDC006733 TaxID=3155460 RepID=UPI00340A4E90
MGSKDSGGGTDARESVGRYGIWNGGMRSDDPELRGEIAEAAAELDELGFGAIWLGGSASVEDAARVLDASPRITVATGILSIWDHEADAVAARTAEVEAAHPGRFLLGLGVSHAQLSDRYRRPYSAMVAYLDALDAAPAPVPAGRRVLAALGPKMLELSRDRAGGAHPYLVTPEHTEQARALLGEGPLLAPEFKIVLEKDPDVARGIARGYLAPYLAMPNYTNSFLRLGFEEGDFTGGGSDRLIDTVFAWGDDDHILGRIKSFRTAGADHVALQVVTGQARSVLPRAEWRRLAEVLG